MWGKFPVDPPCLTVDTFEDRLSSDDILWHFLNEFLSLPSFPEWVQYNKDTRAFEVVSDAAVVLSNKIRTALHLCQSEPFDVPTDLALKHMIDNRYSVICLDRDQAMEWIIQERLPLFIQSDCYFEYRLATLLSQWVPRGYSQKEDGSSAQQQLSVPPQPVPPPPGSDDGDVLKTLDESLGQASVTDMLTITTDSGRLEPPVHTYSVDTLLDYEASRDQKLNTSRSLTNKQPSHAGDGGPQEKTGGPQEKIGSASRSPVLGGRTMERMLNALHVDSKAGFYFKQYCERSGNQIWENAIHFWCDLQQYHQLFYQGGIDPYKVQRQAQVSICCNVGVEEEVRKRVYACLTPPFEELFDRVEEHVLTVLLEPWTQLTTWETLTFQKVGLWEETRQVESEQYGELQALYQESAGRLKQQHIVAQSCRSSPQLLEVPRCPAVWAAVAEQFRGYRLGSLLQHPLELQHFKAFLQDKKASSHLECWLDIEYYRRIPLGDEAVGDDKSKLIKDNYLSRKYFFGPDSPASKEQQDHVMGLAGGWDRLLHEHLGSPVLMEVQNIVRSHIESTWLPLFLATPAFTERQQTLRPRGEDRQAGLANKQHRKRRAVWKPGKWMTSAGDILALRQALLNPLTCHQFRLFVSLKGDSLENDILFWLEVQRYKDLCHSHCEDSVVQDKVSTIISCFIQSAVPPSLQISIPLVMAQNILERRREMGPYVFREAQNCVFSELLKLWPGFLSFSSSVEQEEILPELENRRRHHKASLQRRRRREEKRSQEGVEKLPEELMEEGSDNVEEKKQNTQWELHTNSRLCWSYSKYISALEREEVLLQGQTRRGFDSCTSTDSLSSHSLKSEGSRTSVTLLAGTGSLIDTSHQDRQHL
ncbi:hypothetical protein UPYG_G00304590 [Umbra pygmaea]|uniref:RGS domain-containing protein n=1 Tax=Umbra pygmaea TaxID=75934 RepID=A0ABD0VYN2_UMBPY